MKKQISLFLLSLAVMASFSSPVCAEDGLVKAGSVLRALIPLTAGGIAYSKDDGEGLWQLVQSEVVTIVATEALKRSVDSTRPNGEKESFPSGHASMSFAAAQFLQQRYGYTYGVPAYLASSFVAYSRVHGDQHYWKDVIAGAAIGIASSYYFTEPLFGARVSALPWRDGVMFTARQAF
jgi:membrane-associated phospholipid phosphatase